MLYSYIQLGCLGSHVYKMMWSDGSSPWLPIFNEGEKVYTITPHRPLPQICDFPAPGKSDFGNMLYLIYVLSSKSWSLMDNKITGFKRNQALWVNFHISILAYYC